MVCALGHNVHWMHAQWLATGFANALAVFVGLQGVLRNDLLFKQRVSTASVLVEVTLLQQKRHRHAKSVHAALLDQKPALGA